MKISSFLQVPPLATAQSSYLLGLRGLLTISTFLCTFLSVFVPATVKSSSYTTEYPESTPLYQNLLRKIFSPLLWNPSLLYALAIFISARTICIPFFLLPTKTVLVSSLFRRAFRLLLPLTLALALVQVLSSLPNIYPQISDFISKTKNPLISVPYVLPNALAFFNSLFMLFFSPSNTPIYLLSGVRTFPSGFISVLSTIYSQSYTLYTTCIVIPYTRPNWRIKFGLAFILTAYWVSSWSWFSITALLLTDSVYHMSFLEKSAAGIPVFKRRFPTWIIYAIILGTGLGLQYWYEAAPENLQVGNAELKAHTDMYGASGGLTSRANEDTTFNSPRIADYLVIVGGFLFLEMGKSVQQIFNSRILVVIGLRSFSISLLISTHYETSLTNTGIFLIHPVVIYMLGIPLYMHLTAEHNINLTPALATFVVLLATLAVLIPVQEIFYRIVEVQSGKFARGLWSWMGR